MTVLILSTVMRKRW